MFKEQGYDEFMARKIKIGLEQSNQGLGCSLEEANAEWQAVIEQIEADSIDFEGKLEYA